MKNLRISLKLMISFIIIAFLAAIVGLVGVIGMIQMDNATTEMYETQTEPLPHLSKVVETLQRMRVNMREYALGVIENNPSQIDSAYTAIEGYKKIMTENLDIYYSTMTDKEAIALFDEARRVYDSAYMDSLATCYNLAKAGDAEGILNELSRARDDIELIVANFDECMEIKTISSAAASDGTSVLSATLLTIIIIALVSAVVISLALAAYISGLISKPVSFMKDMLLKIGTNGNLNFTEAELKQTEEYAAVRDEVGESMGMLLTTVRRLSQVGRALEQVAGGDLTAEIDLLSKEDTMGTALTNMIDNLNNMFGEIDNSTAQVSTGSNQIADGAQALAQGSTEQASAVEQLSASISDIAAKTKENAGMANKAAELASEIKKNAEKGSAQMDQMTRAVHEINEASQSISKVISVIDNIAFQTNILALNAAVEAARAGQHGKGFAVVAEEVRSLAAKSAEAAKDTSGLIANSMEKAELGARIADETAASLTEIVAGIGKSSEIVSAIAVSSEEQTLAINQINTGIDQVSQVVQQNSATAEQSAAASEEMSGQSSMLRDLVGRFKLKEGGSQAPSMPSYTKKPAASQKIEMPKKTVYNPPVHHSEDGFGKY